MSYQTIDYFKDSPVGLEVRDISYYPWHRHEDALEIMCVLKGDLDITMSCEHFKIAEGDIAVMNNRTFHNMNGISEENTVISLYLDLNYYERFYKYIKYTIFILNPNRYDDGQKRAVEAIKDLINKIIVEMNFGHDGGSTDHINDLGLQLLNLLISNFNEVRYYNSKIKPNSLKMERYCLMMKYLNEKFSEKNLLEDISKNEFFCKSYLLHLFRDVSTFSLKDTISFIRNWKSEELLLTTKKSIGEISDECGYSDTKYYYRHFKKWYQCTPAEYRKIYRAEFNSKPVFKEIQIRTIEPEWNSGLMTSKQRLGPINRKSALVYLFEGNDTSEVIDSCIEKNLSPCIGIRYQSRTQQEWEEKISRFYKSTRRQMQELEFWITYDSLDLTDEVADLISRLESSLNDVKIMSIMIF